MDTIRVFLRIARSYHTAYESLIENPPKDVAYANIRPGSVQTQASNATVSALHRIKQLAWKNYTKLFPAVYRITNPEDYDLIHATSGFLISNSKPWVVDVEGVFFLGTHRRDLLSKSVVKRLLSSKHCRFILPWSNAAKSSILARYPEIRDKIEVVYPAVKCSSSDIPKRKSKEITTLFIGRRMLEKGGYEVLEAFRLLSESHKNVKLIMVAPVDSETKKKYEALNIEFIEPNLTRKQVTELFKRSDIFAMPSYVDTFGMVYLEAMKHALPIISLDTYACPEIIEDGINGFVIHNPHSLYLENYDSKYLHNLHDYLRELKEMDRSAISEEIAKKLSILVKNKSLRKRMGANGRKLVTKGKFSIGHRNRILRRIYESCLS